MSRSPVRPQGASQQPVTSMKNGRLGELRHREGRARLEAMQPVLVAHPQPPTRSLCPPPRGEPLLPRSPPRTPCQAARPPGAGTSHWNLTPQSLPCAEPSSWRSHGNRRPPPAPPPPPCNLRFKTNIVINMQMHMRPPWMGPVAGGQLSGRLGDPTCSQHPPPTPARDACPPAGDGRGGDRPRPVGATSQPPSSWPEPPAWAGAPGETPFLGMRRRSGGGSGLVA